MCEDYMPICSRFSPRGLALALALTVPLATLLITRAAFAPACDAARSATDIAVYVDNERLSQFSIQNDTRQNPIEVEHFQTVEVQATIVPQPAGCSDSFNIDWELSFVVFEPHEIRTIRETANSAHIEIMLGEQRPNPQGEDHIVVVVRDASGHAIRAVIIQLKGKRI